jgi:UDP-N-acetylmuramate--alanine ligase
VPGYHNVRNALAAIAVAGEMDIPFDKVASALSEFTSVERRMQIISEESGIMVIDDYAHHPTEIIASLEGIRAAFARRIIAVFQPHLYSRTRDFHEDFGRAFMNTDILFVTNIYPSREAPIEGVTGRLVSESAQAAGHRHVAYIEDKKELVKAVDTIASKDDIVITFGAGDINKVGYELVTLFKKRIA